MSDLIWSLCNSPVKVSDPWKDFVNLNVFQKSLPSKSDWGWEKPSILPGSHSDEMACAGFVMPKSLSCTHPWPGTCWHHPSVWPGCGRETMGCHPRRRWPQSYTVQSCPGCKWQRTCHLYYRGQWLFWVSPLGPVDHREMLFRMLSSNHSRKTLTHFAH